MQYKEYKKYNDREPIAVGDLVSLIPETNQVTRSKNKHYKNKDKFVVGVCKSLTSDKVIVVSEGIIDVNVEGIICIGDRLTTSEIAGKARAIRNDNDDIRIFDIRPIGKVIGLYNDYSIAKVLLGIE